MTDRWPAVELQAWTGSGLAARRAAFILLLALAALVPHISSDGLDFPAVSNVWGCLPFCALMLLPLIDPSAPRRLLNLDLLALLSFLLALAALSPTRTWPAALIYPPLIYLTIRMLAIARVGRRAPMAGVSARAVRSSIPHTWLVGGILVLSVIHLAWALQGSTLTDVGQAGVRGAADILHGRALYGAGATVVTAGGMGAHTDTYGPFNYEAYVPFAAVAPGPAAARLTTLFFDLLTALLLFLLGRQIRGPGEGALLAYCWLAFPFALYDDAFGFNDSIVAAALLGTVLVLRHPVRSGVTAAVAAWTKLSPLALLPLLASRPAADGRTRRSEVIAFSLGFLLTSALIFIPALTNSSPSAFISSTIGFQGSRVPADSLWSLFEEIYPAHARWIEVAARVLHGLLAAVAVGAALVLPRLAGRRDAVGVAAVSAGVLLLVEMNLGYWAFSYVLWFAPLVLIALLLGESAIGAERSRARQTQRAPASAAAHVNAAPTGAVR